jgi:dihydroorotate dehydrogenase
MYTLIRPLLFSRDPEKIHDTVRGVGAAVARTPLKHLLKAVYGYSHPMLQQEALGLTFDNPIGLAAGFDKHAELMDILPLVGFGHQDVGSITAQPRPGNPKPRLFRLPEDQGLINRMGLNNEGATEMAKRLVGRDFRFPVSINITKTHDPEIMGADGINDFVESFTTLYPGADMMTINVSCPNTTEGKTFEEVEPLDQLLSALRKAQQQFTEKKPLLVKFSPDLKTQDVDQLLEVCKTHAVEGYVIANTSSQREGLNTSGARLEQIGNGGVSGRPVRESSTDLISHIYRTLESPFIIGVGGVFRAQDAYDKIKAGASLVQSYTGVVYEGPAFAKKVNTGLVRLLKQDGFTSVTEAIGADHK